jgi:glycolate oxidase FAD binding subunit
MSSPTQLPQIHMELAEVAGNDQVQSTATGILVAPTTTNSIAQVVEYAKQRGLSIGIVGGGTKQQWLRGETPAIQLSLRRLDRVLEHAYQDLTCTVQAGCTWTTLQETLKQHGQFVALDPLFSDQATVGGILATNDSGPLRHRYGSLRDLVIGVTLVLADGTIAKSGGKVVKNVAGYDLCKLMTGSYGTLAIVTEVTFRLHPLPQNHRTFTVVAESAVQVAGLVAALRASHLLIQSLQIRRDSGHCNLDIRLNAHPESRQDSILEQVVHSYGLISLEASDDVWAARGHLYGDNDYPPTTV